MRFRRFRKRLMLGASYSIFFEPLAVRAAFFLAPIFPFAEVKDAAAKRQFFCCC